MISLQHAMGLPAVQHNDDVAYLPKPNRVSIVLTPNVAPREYTRTVFVLPFMTDGTLVLTNNRRRGIEVPGGHIDPGEDYEAAATREVFEETGCLIYGLKPIGFQRMVSEGHAPEGWKYPHPYGFQQYFSAKIALITPYAENDECIGPALIPREKIDEFLGHRHFFAKVCFYG